MKYTFTDLVSILTRLRAPDGCPWDREQTHESIRRNLIEETYEVVEAIDRRDAILMREELGDLLMQVVFHAEIERVAGNFDIDDVADGICRKLISRHPHVFGEIKTVESSSDVIMNWDAIKKIEKGHSSLTDTLEAVSRSFPSLVRAEKLARKSRKEEYTDIPPIPSDNSERIGQALFALCDEAGKLCIDPEEALYFECDRFIERQKKISAQHPPVI